MSIAQMTPLMAALLACAAGLALLSFDDGLPRLPAPGIALAHRRIDDPNVQVEPILDFTHYYGGEEDSWRHLNPFLPWRERSRQAAQLERPTREITAAPRPPPTPPETSRPLPPPPRLELPPLDLDAMQRPRVIGMIGDGETGWFLVSYAGHERRAMRIGEELAGWQLDGIDGQHALFTDPDGGTHRLIIGSEPHSATVIGADSRPTPVADDDGPVSEEPAPEPTGRVGRGRGRGRRPRDEDDIPTDPAALNRMLEEYIRQYPELGAFLQANPGMRDQILANPRLYIRLGRRYLEQQER